MSLTVSNCRFCGCEFSYQKVCKPKVFCSDRCGFRFRSGWEPTQTVCEMCGSTWKKSHNKRGRPRKYCSDECRCRSQLIVASAERSIRRGVINCGWCCRSFEPRQFGQRFCSLKCNSAWNRHRKLWGNDLVCMIPLCVCGRQILHNTESSRARPPRASMCRECRTEKKRIHDAMRNSHKQRQRRAAVKAGQRFTKLDVVQAHGSICYICGDDVSFDRSLPLRDRASLDHVVPIFHGGRHTLENCRIVHYGCNARKGARLLSQVA